MTDLTVTKALANVEALKALGQTSVYLYRPIADDDLAQVLPYVVSLKAGGTHRLDMDTSIQLVAVHPSGLQFRWSFDIEPASANGSAEYQIDVEGCRRLMARLPSPAKQQLADYFRQCSAKVNARGNEYQRAASRQHHDAMTLAALAEEAP